MTKTSRNYLVAVGLFAGTFGLASQSETLRALPDTFKDRIEGYEQPPENQGVTQLTGREHVGKLTHFIFSEVRRQRTLDQAQAFIATYAVKDLLLSDKPVMERYADEDIVGYFKADQSGQIRGFDIGQLEFVMRDPEEDEDDGKRDGQCATLPESGRYRGCRVGVFANNGWLQGIPGLGADNEEQIGGFDVSFVDDVLQSDLRCVFDNYYLPQMNSSLERFGESITGPDRYTEAAKRLVRGNVRLQDFLAGTPPQVSFMKLEGSFDVGPTVQNRLSQEAQRKGFELDKVEIPHDYCMQDTEGESAIHATSSDSNFSIGVITIMGGETVPAYYNPAIDDIDSNNSFFAPLSNENKVKADRFLDN